jgi:hypothetical protein
MEMTRPKILWVERVCNVCDSNKVEDEKHILLECTTYMDIRSHFQKNCNTTHIYNMLNHVNQCDIDDVISKLFEGRNK